MTPKEKAKDLVDKFYCKTDSLGLMFCLNYSNAKQCASIVVDEILKDELGIMPAKWMSDYWKVVKQEVEKL